MNLMYSINETEDLPMIMADIDLSADLYFISNTEIVLTSNIPVVFPAFERYYPARAGRDAILCQLPLKESPFRGREDRKKHVDAFKQNQNGFLFN
jgi:hypothetical protein